MSRLALGVDIGGTKIMVGLVDETGRVIGEIATAPTPAREGPSAILARVAALVEATRSERSDVAGVGIGSAGVFDVRGTVTSSTDILPGWAGTPVSNHLAALTGLRAVTVNDVHAAAIGEGAAGAAILAANAIVVTVGTGVGGALILDSRTPAGRSGVAGSVGHIALSREPILRCSCGQLGHSEPYASGPGMERDHLERFAQNLPLREIAARASKGEARATATLRRGAEALGEALASAANIIDPDLIVVGGGVSSIGDLYLDFVRSSFSARAMAGPSTTPIVAALLGPPATLVGAGLLALETFGSPRDGQDGVKQTHRCE